VRAARRPRPYPPGVTLQLEPQAPPEEFAAGLVSLHEVLDGTTGELREGLSLSLVPAPRKMAPWSVAVAAEVLRDDDDVASGRFVVLHDPQGQDGWRGCTRVVALVEAQVEAEMAADPALGEVGWSWLLEALDARGALHTAAGGTVTRTVSQRFGVQRPGAAEQSEDGETEDSEVEVRASWTALPGPDGLQLGAHLLAWCDLLGSTAGLPPPGVRALHPVSGSARPLR